MADSPFTNEDLETISRTWNSNKYTEHTAMVLAKELLQARAALSHSAGQDGEQCRAASGYAGRLASKLEDVREGIADVLPIVYLETIDDAIEALRALSRGVPEGMVFAPVEPTPEMIASCPGGLLAPACVAVYKTMISAAIAAQRKESHEAGGDRDE